MSHDKRIRSEKAEKHKKREKVKKERRDRRAMRFAKITGRAITPETNLHRPQLVGR